jgi:hypothetical protein
MAINLASLRRGGESKPPIILDYSTHGLGKTSFGAFAPNPVFLQTEDGLGQLEAPTFGVLKTYDQVLEAIGSLYGEEHDFKTVVLDSADHLEPLIWAETCRLNGWPNIEHPGFGKGYGATADVWRIVLAGLKALRDEKGMGVIILAHSETRQVNAPDVEAPFDRYQPKLHKIASALLQEVADCVFFMNYRVSILKDNPKDANSRARGVGGGMRVLYTEERPSHLAKNRYRMPAQIPLPDKPEMMWSAVAQHIPYYNTAANVAEAKE